MCCELSHPLLKDLMDALVWRSLGEIDALVARSSTAVLFRFEGDWETDGGGWLAIGAEACLIVEESSASADLR